MAVTRQDRGNCISESRTNYRAGLANLHVAKPSQLFRALLNMQAGASDCFLFVFLFC